MKKQFKKILSGFIIATLMATSIGFGDLEALRTESKTENVNLNVLEPQLGVSTETTTGSALDLKEENTINSIPKDNSKYVVDYALEKITLDELTLMGGDKLNPEAVTYDIQLVDPRDYYDKEKSPKETVEYDKNEPYWTSSNPDVIKINHIRANVVRPNIGESDISVTLTLKAKKGEYSATKSFDVTVKALSQDEIDVEKEYLNRISRALDFEIIKGKNQYGSTAVTQNLAVVYGARITEDEEIKWLYRASNDIHAKIEWEYGKGFGRAGIVNRPTSSNVESFVKATISSNYYKGKVEKIIKEIPITVLSTSQTGVLSILSLDGKSVGELNLINNKFEYELKVDSNKEDIEILAEGSGTVISINGKTPEVGKQSSKVELLSGLNIIDIKSNSVGSSKINTYTLKIIKPSEEVVSVNSRIETNDVTLSPRNQTEVETFDLTEYGISEDRDYPTAMHLLIKTLNDMGIDAKDKDALNIDSNGYLKSIVGCGDNENSWMYSVNGEIPQIAIVDYPLRENDEIVFFCIDWKNGYFSNFDKNFIEVEQNKEFEINLSGKSVSDLVWGKETKLKAIDRAIILVSEKESLSADKETEIKTDKNGNAKISFSEEGEYLISAVRKNGQTIDISRPYCKIKVNKAKIDENDTDFKFEVDKTKFILGEKAKLSALYRGQAVDLTTSGIEFSTAPENILKLDTKTGEVRALKSGTVILTGMLKGRPNTSQSIEITVEPFISNMRVEGYGKTIAPLAKIEITDLDLKKYKIDTEFTEPKPIHCIIAALEKVEIDCADSKKGMNHNNGSYIDMIDGLETFSTGKLDGWMYFVDNGYANQGVNAFDIHSGQSIVMYFVEDYTKNTFSWFDKEAKTANQGESVSLNLTGTLYDMNTDKSTTGPVSDAVILVDNKPYEIDGKLVKTDKDGNAVLKFEKDGKYIISAEKTETQIDKKTKKEVTKRIITRPYCEITIFKGEEPENPLKQIDTSITVDGISKNILETQALKIEENSFALDVLRKSLDQSKIKYEITEGPYGPYVLSINDEKAGTLGGYDGWIYEVNGKSPEVGAGAYKLKDGDKVKFFYSRWPKLNTSSKIVSGEKNPIVKVSLSGDTFKENATGIDNWTITSSEVGLKLKAISKIDNQNMEFVFEGISKDGKLSIIPKKEILVSQKESDSVFVEISSYKKQLEDTLKYLSDKLTKPSVGNEWPILALARSEYSLDKAYVDSYIKNVEKNSANMSKATDYERVAIAITALGKDAEDIGGINLFEKLANFDFLDRQGINASIFGLIAANTRGYEIPKVEGTVNQNSKDNMLEYILSEELDGGGWALYGEVADPDITAMAIQALAPYYKQGDKTVEEAVDRALKVLSKLQTQDGDYLSWGSANPESAVQVLVALCELGKDPMDTKNGFVKDGKSLIDGIMKYKVDGGGFKHSLSETSVNGMATEQCAYGLVAYERFVNGKTSLYDMSDVEFKTDKTKLSDLIKEAKSKNKRDYKKESWKNLVSVLESAKKVNSNPTSKQKDIDAAIKGLESALLKLELKKSEKLELKDGKVEIPLDDDKDFDVELKSDQKAQILIPENAESKVLLKTESKKALSEIKVKKGKHGLKIPQGVKIEEGHAEIVLFIMKTEVQKAEIKDELSDKIKKLDSKVKDVKVEDAFKIGNTNKIEFSDYVELVFTNMAGKGAAYVDDTGMHIIERVVDEKAGAGKSEYAFDRGNDLVVKTKHFTDFITYSLEKDAGNTGGGTDASGGTGGSGGGTPSKDLTVTLSIDKKTINKGYVLEPTVIKINKGDTVWNVLQKELDNRGVSYRYNNSNQYGSVYVESIAGDGEFDHGRWSGWMYNVNGKYPNYGCSKYILNGGENIEWRYTTNLGEDLGQDNSAWGKPGESTKTETIEKGSTVLKSEAKVEQKEAKAEIDSKFIKGIVSEAVEKKLTQIVIEPTIEDKKVEFNKVSVVLEKESIEKISKEAKASLKLKTKFGDVKLSANTLENLLKEKGNTVTISVKQNEDNTVTVDVKVGLDSLDKISGGMIFTLPVSEASVSNIMVKVAEDNTEQIIMKSVAADKVLSAKLDGSAKVKIVQREVDFADTSAHWAKENIEFVSARDIIKGTKANEFSPNSRVNRAMLTTILHRFENELQIEGQNYSDVTKEAYYSNAALWAKTKGIVSRTEKFGAKEELTREQIAEMIYNYAKASGENVSNISKANVQKFEDFSTIDSASQDAVAYCYEKGIIGGKSETKLDPKGKTTRAEVSAIIQRYISNSVK